MTRPTPAASLLLQDDSLRALAAASIAAAGEPERGRSVLAGVFWGFRGGKWRAASADGFRMAVANLPASFPAPTAPIEGVISRQKALAFSLLTGPISLDVYADMVAAHNPPGDHGMAWEDIAPFIPGVYPDFDQIMPDASSYPCFFDVDSLGLENAVRRMTDLASTIHLRAEPSSHSLIIMGVESSEKIRARKRQGSEVVPVSNISAPGYVAVKSGMIMDALVAGLLAGARTTLARIPGQSSCSVPTPILLEQRVGDVVVTHLIEPLVCNCQRCQSVKESRG